jgi:electron transfer flavoprotein alpha subunit
MNEVWTIAEQYGGKLKAVSFELLSRGRALADKLGVPLVSVLAGDGVSNEALSGLIRRGADAVYAAQSPALADFVCERYAEVLLAMIKERQPQIILAAATTSGRTLMPYLAVRQQTGLTADCTELDIEEGTGLLLQTRPAIGGNIMATIKTPNTRPQMATVRPKSSRPLPEDPGRKGRIEHIPVPPLEDDRVQVLGVQKDAAGFVSIEEADIVAAGGKGLKRAENWHIVEDLAAALGGACGASRDAVDRGWAAYPQQIGLSGKTISPKVYIAVGISGAIQHLAGIKTSESIIAINTDPDANILKLADLAVVGDAFQVAPLLTRKIREKKGGRK